MLDFPSSPTTGQTYTGSDGTQWKWDGAKWVSAQQAIAFPITIPQGGTGAITAPAALTALGAQPIVGVTNGSDAAAGQIGEYKSAILLGNTPASVGGNAYLGIISLFLTAGDWDVWGELFTVIQPGTSVSQIGAFVSVTVPSGGQPSDLVGTNWSFGYPTFPTGQYLIFPAPLVRVSLAAATNVTLWEYANISTGVPLQGFGKVAARRVR